MLSFWRSLTIFHKYFLCVFFSIEILFFVTIPILQDIRIFTLFSIIGFVSAISSILISIFQARAQSLYYGFFLLLALCFIAIGIKYSYYGQVILNLVFFIPLIIIGYFRWYNCIKFKEKGNLNFSNSLFLKVDVRRLNLKSWIILCMVFGIIFAVYFLVIFNISIIFKYLFGVSIPNDQRPFLDSLVSVFYITGLILSNNRYVEQWIFWLIGDVLGCLLFLSPIFKGSSINAFEVSIVVVYIRAFIGSSYGFYLWKKDFKALKV
ncbi:MAG: nicotinamide riboside transporter PnuC [Psittacicella sp.]